ncbi:MAG: ectoine hydroxylase [Actinomycetota bacterium]|nr:ectoine hydroxylase [Actinomycetota bacterium]
MMTGVLDHYPTRTRLPGPLLERREPVVHDELPGPLDPELVASFEDNGFLVLPSLLPLHKVAAMEEHLEELRNDPSIRRRPEAILEPTDDALRSLFAVHRLQGPIAELARDPHVVGTARQLLGSDVYVHQSRVNLKPGFRGRDFYWHSDFETWHAEDGMPRMRAISVSVLLTENRTCNGPLLTIPGSHRWFVPCVGETPERHHERSLRQQEVGVPSDQALTALAEEGGIVECTGPPGTCIVFDCNLMHGSNGNITPYPRRNVFLVYNSIENALVEPYAAPAPRPEHIASRTFEPV